MQVSIQQLRMHKFPKMLQEWHSDVEEKKIRDDLKNHFHLYRILLFFVNFSRFDIVLVLRISKKDCLFFNKEKNNSI